MEGLIECVSLSEKKTFLKHNYPSVYGAYLTSMSMNEELNSLFDGKVTGKNLIWYINIKLLPLLAKLRKEGKLKAN